MRKIVGLIVLISIGSFSYGQRTELSVQAGTGLFSYRGPNAVDATSFYLMEGYLLNPYGRAGAFSYSLTGQVQFVTRAKLLYGLQAGYEQLTSQVAIVSVSGDPGGATPASGYATLQNHYLNLSPFFGKRFGTNRFSLDATIGMDVAIGLYSREFIRVEKVFQTLLLAGGQNQRLADDFRPRINVIAYYRSVGLSAGYSYGLTNYLANPHSSARVYSQFWRLGILYRLRK